MPAATILLAACNGEKYIAEQLRSIQAQSENDWCLIARDDASSDGTLEILKAFAKEDSRIQVIESDNCKRLGAKGNFGKLIDIAASGTEERQAILFCDQDDRWSSVKLETVLGRLQREDPDKPVAVASDLSVIDSAGEVISNSFRRSSLLLRGKLSSPADACSRNVTPGCALAINSRLLSLINPVPDQAVMHDWWAVLLAFAAGTYIELPEPLVAYRQHEGNAIGSTSVITDISRKGKIYSQERRDEIRATFAQATAAVERLNSRGLEVPLSVERYSRLPSLSRNKRLREALKLGVRKSNPLLLCAFMLGLTRLPRLHQ